VDNLARAARRLLVLACCLLVLGGGAGHAQPCVIDEHTMENGDPAATDGALRVRVDALGWTGRGSFNARETTYNPPGEIGALEHTLVESVLVLNGDLVRECVDGEAEVISAAPRRIESVGRVGLFDLHVVQSVTAVVDGTSTLVQRYTITPRRLDITGVDLVHLVDAELSFPESFGRAGAGEDGLVLYEFRSQGGDEATPLVAAEGDLDGYPRPDRWTVQGDGYLSRITDDGRIDDDDDGVVAADGNGDGITDASERFALYQQFSEALNAGRSVTLTLVTRWGHDEPSQAVAEPIVDRVGGADRVATAVAVSQRVRPDPQALPDVEQPVVVLARADAYPDALAAAPLAHRLDAPVLLTSSERLDGRVAEEVTRLRARRAVLLGGPQALSPRVEDDLRERTGVTEIRRVAGENRFATAAAIAREVGGREVFIAEGIDADPRRGWPDALAAAPLAAFGGRPILLVETDSVPGDTRQALTDLAVDAALVVGGPGAVSEAVVDDLRAGGVAVERVAGATRYETAALLADRSRAAGLRSATTWLASGENFPDALAAAPAVAKSGGVLLLAPPQTLAQSTATTRALIAEADAIERALLLGGPSALSDTVRGDVLFVLRNPPR
jgi:putative cell wall-binding protein